MLVARRKPEEAFSWVERGLALGEETAHDPMASHGLRRLKRDLLRKLGRGDEAIEDAWSEFCKCPSECFYDDLMKYVPKAERAAWHQKAIKGLYGVVSPKSGAG